MLYRNHSLSAGAALLLLLTGCGDGTGTTTDPSIQAQLSAPDQNNPVALMSAGPQEKASANASVAATGTVDTKAAVEADSISGELLANMLIIDTNEAGGLFALQATGPMPRGAIMPAPLQPALRGNQQISRHGALVGDYRVRSEVAMAGALSEYAYSGGRFHNSLLTLPMWVNDDPNTPSTRAPFSLGFVQDQPAGTELVKLLAEGNLEIGGGFEPNWLIGGGVSPDDGGGSEAVQSSNGQAFTIRMGDRIPLDTVLHTWTGGNGAQVELMVLKGATSGDLRHCFNMRLARTNRLWCTLWTVPRDWKLGDGLGRARGVYIVDDASAYPNQSGMRYWMTPYGDARVGARVPEGLRSLPTRLAVSPIGISGDVLAAMLSQSGSVDAIARPSSGPIGRGKPSADTGRPDVRATVDTSGIEILGAGSTFSLQTRQQDGVTAYRHLRTQFGMTAYQQPEGSSSTISFENGAALPRHTQLINLTHNARLTWTNADGSETKAIFHPTRPFAARKDNLLTFNRVLQSWRSVGGHHIDLFVLRGEAANQVQLCTRVQIPAIQRITCSNWLVPAGWTLGQPLTQQGVSIADDRAAYSGDATEWFWQSAGIND